MPPPPRAPAGAPLQPRAATRRDYSPDLLASARRRIKETNEPWRLIAVDFGLHPSSMQRLAKRMGWKRPVRPPGGQTVFVKENNGGRPPKYYTPEFLAEARRRIEETLDSMTSIAGNLGMHHSVLSRLVKREGWVRPEGSLRRRGLSPAMRIAAETDALVLASGQQVAQPEAIPARGQADRTGPAASPADELSAVDRLEQAVLKEIASVEAMRASLGSEPLRPMDAERTARALSVLTETLSKLRRLRLAAAAPAGPDYDDDMPADIDEFRRELARRIRVFVQSRTGGNDTRDRDSEPAVVAPV